MPNISTLSFGQSTKTCSLSESSLRSITLWLYSSILIISLKNSVVSVIVSICKLQRTGESVPWWVLHSVSSPVNLPLHYFFFYVFLSLIIQLWICECSKVHLTIRLLVDFSYQRGYNSRQSSHDLLYRPAWRLTPFFMLVYNSVEIRSISLLGFRPRRYAEVMDPAREDFRRRTVGCDDWLLATP